MYIKVEVEGFYWLKDNCWGGAIDTLNTIEDNEKEDELIDWLEQYFDCGYNELPTLTELNDYLWFEDEEIFEALGIGEEEYDEYDDDCWDDEDEEGDDEDDE